MENLLGLWLVALWGLVKAAPARSPEAACGPRQLWLAARCSLAPKMDPHNWLGSRATKKESSQPDAARPKLHYEALYKPNFIYFCQRNNILVPPLTHPSPAKNILVTLSISFLPTPVYLLSTSHSIWPIGDGSMGRLAPLFLQSF